MPTMVATVSRNNSYWVVIFNDLERPLTKISMARHYLNVVSLAKDETKLSYH